jgi:hypothetical protein
MMPPVSLSRIATIAFLLTCAAGAEAVTVTVTSTANSGPGSLNQAITDANGSGGTIVFDLPGNGPHVIELTSALPFFQADIQIINDAPGDEAVTVHRSGTVRFPIFGITAGHVLIAGLTVSNGYFENPNGAGGISNFANTTVRNCTISGNDGFGAGGLSNFNISDSTPATLTLINCTVSDNGAGGVRNYCTASHVATASLTNCVISGNSNFTDGGGVNNVGSAETASVTLTDCLVTNNSAPEGGGVANLGTLVMNNCTIADNTITDMFGYGGGIHNEGAGSITVTNSTLSGNSAPYGGAISFENGAATVAISNSTLSLNTATHQGGALYNDAGGTVTITNCTFSGNSIPGDFGQGGAIHNGGSSFDIGRVDIINSTFAGNAAATGAAIRNYGNTDPQQTILTLVNTVLKAGQSGSNIVNDNGIVTSLGHNLSSDSAGGDAGTNPGGLLNATGDIRNTDPHLGPLASNGGSTQTHALLAGSAAINGADEYRAPSADQRGSPRVDVSDIGSFEAQVIVPAVFANISTRLRVEIGDNVLIGGFIITGTQPKKVIVRAIGPSLPFAGALADPVLELHGPNGFVTITNDNWRSDQEAEIIATTIPPSNDLESAIVATLPANNSAYTAIVRGVNDGAGIGVVEAYDLDGTVDSKLANISTRGLVQTEDNVLIGGLIVLGQDPLRVLVRAIGPSLLVPGTLGDPTLELRNGDGALLASNDNWRSNQEPEIIASTLPPSNDLESAIVLNLTPGNYTAIVRGVNGTTGVALVEAYGLN